MSKKHSHSADLRGLSRLVFEAISGLTDVAEDVNLRILDKSTPWLSPIREPISGTTSLLYRRLRTITHLFGNGLDVVLHYLSPLLSKSSGWPGREPVLAVLNGVLGDHLEASNNPLCITMALRHNGQPLSVERQALQSVMPDLNGDILILVHGLCMNDMAWLRRGHDHGAALAKEKNFTPVYLHYNSGRHISINGRQFAELLESLVQQWPVEVNKLVILGHSMGGMLARSAFYYGTQAGHHWPGRVDKLIFLGTPHHGAPLERGGNWFHVIADNSAFTAPLSSLGKIRSAGITDLRYGNLLDQDWQSHDRFAHVGDQRTGLPLPTTVPCFSIAATTGQLSGDIKDRLLGDGLVPVDSALGRHKKKSLHLNFSPQNQRIIYDTNHLGLLESDAVFQQLLAWL